MRARVLVVDDDPALAEMLGHRAAGRGLRPGRSSRRRQGRAGVPGPQAGHRLLDLMLPGMSGIDVCRAIRLESGIPIIMLTAKSDTVDVCWAWSPAPMTTWSSRSSRRNCGPDPGQAAAREEPPAEQLAIARSASDVPGHQVLPRRGVRIPYAAGVRPARRAGRSPGRCSPARCCWKQSLGYRHAADTRLVNVHVPAAWRSKIERDSGAAAGG